MRIFDKLLSILILIYPCFAFAALSSAAFYYGPQPPLDRLHAFDIVVVDPDSNVKPSKDNLPSSELFAYVSVGEVDPSASYAKQIPQQWILGENKVWHAKI